MHYARNNESLMMYLSNAYRADDGDSVAVVILQFPFSVSYHITRSLHISNSISSEEIITQCL